MQVQRVLVPGSAFESWTVLDDESGVLEPAEQYLAHLSDIEWSPNTVKAYAHDLKDWFDFLGTRGLDWREVRLEDVGRFVAWLRLPPGGREGSLALLPSAQHHCGAATINRKLSAVSSFYAFHARHGVDVGDLLAELRPAGSRGTAYRPFLHHVSAGQPERRRTVKLKAPVKHPRVLTPEQAQAVLDGCTRLRDRFLFALLWETGMRVGEALGLRHEDVAAAEGEVAIVPRPNANGARVKSGRQRTVPVGPEVVRLYADYLHTEYGDLDSDYVFVNLWAGAYGHPLTYEAVYDLVQRIRKQIGFDFGPHWFRHTRATTLLRQGVPVEMVSKLLGHASVTTTEETYSHLTTEDARRALVAAGVLTGAEARS